MSYCRMNGKTSDVYMFHSISGYIECCGCRLGIKKCPHCGERNHNAVARRYIKPPKFTQFKSRRAAIKHLLKHKAEGDKVPMYAIKALQREIREEEDRIPDAKLK